MLNKYSKDDYILRSLSKISHKKWELFIVSRIIHNVDDPEIEFSCQQAIRTKNQKLDRNSNIVQTEIDRS